MEIKTYHCVEIKYKHEERLRVFNTVTNLIQNGYELTKGSINESNIVGLYDNDDTYFVRLKDHD